MLRILSIDPSINDLGLCTFEEMGSVFESSTIRLDRELNLHYRLNVIKSQLPEDIHQLVYEEPTFMASSAGKIAAQKGYTIDLGIVCGYVIGHYGLHPSDVFGYTPSKWKGTVPKRATQAKYQRTFGTSLSEKQLDEQEHEIDATMMLHFHCQKMKYI